MPHNPSVKSAGVAVLSAEVRVLQVGNLQLTRSMYRQLDEAAPERFEPFGRVRDGNGKPSGGVLKLVGRDTATGALVRHGDYAPDWSASEAPEEFTHWLTHTNQSPGRYRVATGPDGRYVVWTRRWTSDGDCPGPSGWHVSKDKPDLQVVQVMWETSSYSPPLEENKETRIGVLRRIVLAFSYSPPPEAKKETQIEQGSYSQWLEENRAKRCTVDLVELGQAWRARAEAGAGRDAGGAGQIRRVQSTAADHLARLSDDRTQELRAQDRDSTRNPGVLPATPRGLAPPRSYFLTVR